VHGKYTLDCIDPVQKPTEHWKGTTDKQHLRFICTKYYQRNVLQRDRTNIGSKSVVLVNSLRFILFFVNRSSSKYSCPTCICRLRCHRHVSTDTGLVWTLLDARMNDGCSAQQRSLFLGGIFRHA